MLHWLKRHPIPIEAFFRQSLVLTYAFPQELLKPLLPPGLTLDTYHEFGFVAIALVWTEALRPVFMPAALGQDFFLTGYRLFARFKTSSGSSLRGLRILRSDADRRLMVVGGNLLTHYQYRKCQVAFAQADGLLEITIKTPHAEADLRVVADLASRPAPLPAGSPFLSLTDARKFAGPLPFTFDYEKETHSIVRIKGVRRNWNPQPIAVEVCQNTFFHQEPFRQTTPILANAFHVEGIPYRWERGIREVLPGRRV
jgi:hypothetical protein